MNIALVQPNLNEHGNKIQAYGSINRPPETGLAVLCSWVKNYSNQSNLIKIFDPNRDINDIIQEASSFEIVGLTDWFSNHDNCIEIARGVKLLKPKIKVVFGGPNASMMPQLLLRNHQYIDYVVQRDGEESLLGLTEGRKNSEIPNLWYRDLDGSPNFSFVGFTGRSLQLLYFV